MLKLCMMIEVLTAGKDLLTALVETLEDLLGLLPTALPGYLGSPWGGNRVLASPYWWIIKSVRNSGRRHRIGGREMGASCGHDITSCIHPGIIV